VRFELRGLLGHAQEVQDQGDSHVLRPASGLDARPPGPISSAAPPVGSIPVSPLDLTSACPGVSALMNSVVGGSWYEIPGVLLDAGRKVPAAFGFDRSEADDERMVRVISAAGGLGAATLLAIHADGRREWRGSSSNLVGISGRPFSIIKQ
jgi:hypothetical protein